MRELKFRIRKKKKPVCGKPEYFTLPNEFFKREDLQVCPDDDDYIDQFTGAYDVNGEEIYENDKVMYSWKINRFDSDGENYELIECIVKFKDFGFFACWGYNNCNKESLRHSKQMKIIKG